MQCKMLPVAAPKALGMSKISIYLTTKGYTKDLTELQECIGSLSISYGLVIVNKQ